VAVALVWLVPDRRIEATIRNDRTRRTSAFLTGSDSQVHAFERVSASSDMSPGSANTTSSGASDPRLGRGIADIPIDAGPLHDKALLPFHDDHEP